METRNTHISYHINDEQSSNTPDFYQFGTEVIDKELYGVKPGELVTLFGDIASCKTTLSIRMLDHQAIDNKAPSLYFCVRNEPQNIIQRIIGYQSSIPFRDVELDKRLRSKRTDSLLQKIAESPIYLYAAKRVTIDEVCEICKQHVEDYGVKIVFLHYLYIEGQDKAYRLRLLAREIGVAIVLLENKMDYGEGIIGVLPWLKELNYDHLNEYSDVVIGLCDYSSYKIYADENGLDLRGCLHVEILKTRDGNKGGEYYIEINTLHQKKLPDDILYVDDSN